MTREFDPNCTHPDHALQYVPGRPFTTPAQMRPPTPARMICGECDWSMEVRDCEDFVKLREAKWKGENPVTYFYADMFGNEIKVGSMVVYPTLSGRSATLSYGEVLEINPPTKAYGADTWENKARRVRCNAPDRLKVQPMPYTSRWRSWRSGNGDMKPVTLSANAPSAVVIS